MRHLSRPIAALALLGLAGCVGAPAPGPVVYAPPAAYAQPGYSQGSPGYPPGTPLQTASYGVTCYAGVYTCQLPQQLPVGAQCSCPGLGAPSFGNVR